METKLIIEITNLQQTFEKQYQVSLQKETKGVIHLIKPQLNEKSNDKEIQKYKDTVSVYLEALAAYKKGIVQTKPDINHLINKKGYIHIPKSVKNDFFKVIKENKKINTLNLVEEVFKRNITILTKNNPDISEQEIKIRMKKDLNPKFKRDCELLNIKYKKELIKHNGVKHNTTIYSYKD